MQHSGRADVPLAERRNHDDRVRRDSRYAPIPTAAWYPVSHPAYSPDPVRSARVLGRDPGRGSRRSSARAPERQRKADHRAQVRIGLPLSLAIELDLRGEGEQLVQCHRRDQTRERRSDAQVHARAERHVRARAIQPRLVRRGEDVRVPVGGADDRCHLRAGPQVAPGERRRTTGDAVDQLDGAVEAQQLLDGGREQVGLGAQAGGACQGQPSTRFSAVGDQVCRRQVAGDEDVAERRDQLLAVEVGSGEGVAERSGQPAAPGSAMCV